MDQMRTNVDSTMKMFDFSHSFLKIYSPKLESLILTVGDT